MSEKWSEEARQARNAYMAKWRERNRDKVRESQRRYWERVARQKAVRSS